MDYCIHGCLLKWNIPQSWNTMTDWQYLQRKWFWCNMEAKFICCNFLERNSANILVILFENMLGLLTSNFTDSSVTHFGLPTKEVTEACVLDCCEGCNWIYAGDTSPWSLPMTWSSITRRHTTLGRNPLDDWSAYHIALYVTTHNSHKRQSSMSPTDFEPAISANQLP